MGKRKFGASFRDFVARLRFPRSRSGDAAPKQIPVARKLPNTNIMIFRRAPVEDVIRECQAEHIKRLFSVVGYTDHEINAFRDSGIEVLPITYKKNLIGFERFFRWASQEKAAFGIQCMGGRHASCQYASYFLMRNGVRPDEIRQILTRAGSDPGDIAMILNDASKYFKKYNAEARLKWFKK